MKKLFTAIPIIVSFVLSSYYSSAQAPNCPAIGGLIYYVTGSQIWNFDPNLPPGPGNPSLNTIVPPAGSGSLAVANNINGGTLSPTFYVIAGGTYQWWNGTAWVNTGHTPGAVNPGGGGQYIYSLEGGGGNVYKYDGTGNATLLMTVPGFAGGGPFDMCADCEGNFYILKITTPGFLNKYSPTGALLQSYTISGATSVGSGGGFGIINNEVYYNNTSGFWRGVIAGTNVNFVQVIPTGLNPSPSDFGTCQIGGTVKAQASIDTGYYCLTPGSTPVSVSVSGSAPYTWTVLSGPAVINGGGQTVTLTSPTPGISKIEVRADGAGQCGGPGKDTVTLIPVGATIDAGKDDTTYGCAVYRDTITTATLTGTTSGVPYSIAWTPAASISAGANTLKPVLTPSGSPTLYTVTVTTAPDRGNCTWTDAMALIAIDATVGTADFEMEFLPGCTEDSIQVTNLSAIIYGKPNYKWVWGDFSDVDTGANPLHVYYAQKDYSVFMTLGNGYCTDTITKFIDTRHPLEAVMELSDDRLCPGDTIQFDAQKSTVTLTPTTTYEWDFGHGETSTLPNPLHTFRFPGEQKIRLIVIDSLGCRDTAERSLKEIVALPTIEVGNDTLICDGDMIYLPLGISVRGTDYLWNDGSTSPRHPVDKPGIYIVKISNECGSDYDTINVTSKNCTLWFPTAFSPNGDGKNDKAYLMGTHIGITDYELAIYNRWGQRVFYAEGTKEGWDGTTNGVPQPMGTYHYYIKYEYNRSEYKMKGDITLIR
jgi:gliding motility-associated-like protein